MSITGPRPIVASAPRSPKRAPRSWPPVTATTSSGPRRPGRVDIRYSVEMFGSACWVTGMIARKCSAGSSMSGASPSAVSVWPLARSASW